MTVSVALIWLGFMSFTLSAARRRVPALVYGALWVGCAAWALVCGFNL